MSKTAKGLVNYAKVALAEQWGYVWGTFGTKLDNELLEKKLAQYPQEVGQYRTFIVQHWMGRKVTDCVGLIKSYIWWDGQRVKYDPKTDVSANGMFKLATVKGPIGTMPDEDGILVWKEGHIGIYIGGGKVIEARGTKAGVIESALTGKGSATWTHWLKCPYVVYESKVANKPSTPVKTNKQPNLEKGNKGEAVKDLQRALCRKGVMIPVDGDFGPKTEKAVQDFQRSRGLNPDGIVGPLTWANLE